MSNEHLTDEIFAAQIRLQLLAQMVQVDKQYQIGQNAVPQESASSYSPSDLGNYMLVGSIFGPSPLHRMN